MRRFAVSMGAMALVAAGAGEAAAATLLDRSGNGNGLHWPSQDFAAPDDAYDSEIADNFFVPFSEPWQLTAVRAIGNGGTATAARVTVYEASASSGPGAILFAREGPATAPNYEVPLNGTPQLSGGLYWISIQAVGGAQSDAWGWSQRSDSNGGPLFRNPGNGYATNCISFSALGECFPPPGPEPDGDMQFVLFGDPMGPQPPSNEFTVGRPKRDKEKGTAKLPVEVVEAGVLTLTGPRLKTARASAAAGATVRLPVVPRRKARKKLKREGALKVTGTVTFTPEGGTGASRQIDVRLKRRP